MLILHAQVEAAQALTSVNGLRGFIIVDILLVAGRAA